MGEITKGFCVRPTNYLKSCTKILFTANGFLYIVGQVYCVNPASHQREINLHISLLARVLNRLIFNFHFGKADYEIQCFVVIVSRRISIKIVYLFVSLRSVSRIVRETVFTKLKPEIEFI